MTLDNAALRSLSVIVPLHNLVKTRGAAVLEATLNSLETSLTYFKRRYPQAPRVTTEIVIVDDGSTDTTFEIVERFTQNKSHYQLIQLPQNLGPAAARNLGVRLSQGEALFFCDGDDRFFPEHLFIAFSVLQQSIPATSQLGNVPEYFGAVRTGIYTRDPLHPHWQKALENTIPLNLCVRRELHDFIGGFPEDPIFREFEYGTEDLAYATWLQPFCHQAWIDRKTVEYVCYPGSHFERQLAKFQAPPGALPEHHSPQQQTCAARIQSLIQAKLTSLQAKVSAHPAVA